jgi:AcrR family transcriptional regulator
MPSTAAIAVARALADPGASPTDATGERILDAAVQISAEVGFRNLTMDAVAERAGVGRMTVYRKFQGRAALIDAMAARETRRALETIGSAINPTGPVADQLTEGFIAAMGLMRDHPLFRRMTLVDPQGLLTALIENRGAYFIAAREFVAGLMREAQRAGKLDPAIDADERAEIMVRLGFSLALIEPTLLPLGDEAGMRDTARRLLVPLLGA